ncbi:MAG: sulfite exporter TauE/SafE family protein [Nitrospirae bacterium]|nr:sulfite exporter TauE/SafE family protein [Nitrospirota bacterium]
MLESIIKAVENPSLLSIPLAYLGGVLASLTPCVYPMIPIVLGVIGASNIESKSKGFTLSLSYAMGLSLVYALMGIFASITGRFFGEIATSPWSYIVFGNLCLFLALWMMEWVNIPLFSSGKTNSRKGHIGVFITGALSGLVAAPCTSPVLAGLLIYVSGTKDMALGGLMMMSFSLGMTTLLILIGAFSGALKTLPRPGAWMLWVKKGLAMALFAISEYFLIKAGGLLI